MTTPSYTDWYVGMKVVCVEDDDLLEGDGVKRISVGAIYTIRKMAPTFSAPGYRLNRLGPVIWLAEVTRRSNGRDLPYSAVRFRPLVARKTDISVFQAMLNPANSKVEA